MPLCSESGIPADPADLRLTAVPGTRPRPRPGRCRRCRLGGPGPTLVHPGAAAPSPRWPPGRFAAVAGNSPASAIRSWLPARRRSARWPWRWPGGRACRPGGPGRPDLAGRAGRAHRIRAPGRLRRHRPGPPGHRLRAALGGPVRPRAARGMGPPADPRHQALWAGVDGYRGDPHGCRTDPALAAIPVSDVLRATGRALAPGRPYLSPARGYPRGIVSQADGQGPIIPRPGGSSLPICSRTWSPAAHPGVERHTRPDARRSRVRSAARGCP